MKFYPQRLFDVQTRRNQLQLIRKCCHFTICHSCWCSFIIGIILLIIGIILICNIIRTSHYNLIMGTGIFFIIIASILLISSPMMAIFEYNIERKRQLATTRNHQRSSSSSSIRQQPQSSSSASVATSSHRISNNLDNNIDDLPNYEDIDIHSVPIYPIRLNHDDNNNNQPPPTYNEIISRQQQQQLQNNNNNNEIVVEVATIEPSQIINMAII
ncbi:uncharacterized protein LOC124500520 isoform X1 [Dermatophagoides farinae]|uniref:uncharacterized protein LOC124500520 isoform X1 n=1 Tax=Dermatophagoides farinae TaxID=6954 RepID=UPI003F5E9381